MDFVALQCVAYARVKEVNASRASSARRNEIHIKVPFSSSSTATLPPSLPPSPSALCSALPPPPSSFASSSSNLLPHLPLEDPSLQYPREIVVCNNPRQT
eukprot:554807-Hanusia_phi.AAC.1